MKKWPFIISLLVIFGYTTVGFIGSRMRFPLLNRTDIGHMKRYYDYAGVTHAHSVLSTGLGEIDEIVLAANKARCDFLILTDLNITERPENIEGYRDDVLLIWGGEFSFLGGHVLAYGLPEKLPFTGLGEAQLYFNDRLVQGDPVVAGAKLQAEKPSEFFVAAHPYLAQHFWQTLDFNGLSGMEVLNLNSMWQDSLTNHWLNLGWSLFIMPFNPELAYLRVFKEPRRQLTAWDEMLQKRSFVGFAGSDATAKAIPFPGRSVKFPSYAQTFALMKNHVLMTSELTGGAAEDKRKILSSLRDGRFYFSLDLIGNPAGFYFVAEQGAREFLLGSEIKLGREAVRLVADLGEKPDLPFEIVLIRNGQSVFSTNNARLEFETHEPGAYRVIVRVIPTLPPPDGKKWFTWIFSNAIRLK
jgi:hypothetical protein